MVALIAGLTFILLARAFRSLVLSLKAVLLNVLSVAAAWGVMVLIWQNGIGSEAIWGIEATRAINVEMPIVVFAFLFGVSMDYQVFIISRMREAYDRTGSTRDGRGRGHRPHRPARHERGADPRARVRGAEREPGHRGQDLRHRAGGGILVDATIVRAMLVPAVVAILGRWNWWLPRWPARVLRVEPSLVRAAEVRHPRRALGDLARGAASDRERANA